MLNLAFSSQTVRSKRQEDVLTLLLVSLDRWTLDKRFSGSMKSNWHNLPVWALAGDDDFVANDQNKIINCWRENFNSTADAIVS